MTDERTGITRVESHGSMWMIDNDLRRYCRFPKHEGPREKPEWSDERAGKLQDAVWHDFHGDWFIDKMDRLHIQVVVDGGDGTWFSVTAPWAEVKG